MAQIQHTDNFSLSSSGKIYISEHCKDLDIHGYASVMLSPLVAEKKVQVHFFEEYDKRDVRLRKLIKHRSGGAYINFQTALKSIGLRAMGNNEKIKYTENNGKFILDFSHLTRHRKERELNEWCPTCLSPCALVWSSVHGKPTCFGCHDVKVTV